MTKIKLLLASMLLVCSFYLSPIKVNAQSTSSRQWTWIGGGKEPISLGVYGTQGVAAATNIPGSRYGGASWTDSSGNLWLMGGFVFGFVRNITVNDLWKYNLATGQWTWVSGDTTNNSKGVYGTKGTAAANNKPGARLYATTWTDASGNLWLMGGNGFGVSGGIGNLNDLWKYNTATGQWTWVSGDNKTNQNGVYGTQGTADASNKPGARSASIGWSDASGNLWLMGGQGNSASDFGNLNDLWKYNITTGQWTWVSGDNTSNQIGVYGTQGVGDVSNKPGARYGSISWTDRNGNFWLMGGNAFATGGPVEYLNDLWKYNLATGQWTWMSGDNTLEQLGVYGTKGTAASTNKPGARASSISWSDASGNLWLMGGGGYAASGGTNFLNDLWKYNTTTGQWTWVSGDDTVGQFGVYGIQGIADANNKPGARRRSMRWTDASGNFWLMGGDGGGTTGYGHLNDLWKLSSDCTPTTATVTVTETGSYTWHGTTYTTSTTTATFDSLNVGGCDSLTTLHLTITPATNTWTGANSTDWFDNGNWSSNVVPDNTIDVVISAAPSNQPIITNTTVDIKNIMIQSGATLTNNGVMNVYGNFADTGNFISGTGSYVVLRGTSGTISGTDTFANLQIQGDYSVGASPTDKIYVTEALLKLSGTLSTSDKLTLISNSNSTALIADYGGALTGKIYMQHYAGGNFGYHHFSSPVSGATVNSWSNAFPIFGPDGAPSWLSNWGSLQYYDEPANTTSLLDSGYYNYTALSNSLVPGQGYTAWLNSLPTLNTFGTPNNGSISIPVTHTAGTNDPKGWNFIGNPYPSPISWTALKALNPGLFGDASCYLWKASGKGTDGTWTSYDGTVGVNGAGDVINSSLGFFVYVNNSGTLNFDNSVRAYDYTSPEIFGAKSATNTLRLSIKDAVANTTDEAVAYTSYKEGFSRKMVQPAGATNATIAFDVKGAKAAINVLTAIDSKTELPISILTPKAGTYSLSLSTKDINLPVYLKDAVTGIYTDLKANSTATITTTAKETVGRYSLVFKQSTVDRLPLTVAPNPASEKVTVKGSHIASVQVVDNLGRVVKTVSLKDATNPSLTVSGLPAGAYHLKVQTTDGKVSGAGLVVSY